MRAGKNATNDEVELAENGCSLLLGPSPVYVAKGRYQKMPREPEGNGLELNHLALNFTHLCD